MHDDNLLAAPAALAAAEQPLLAYNPLVLHGPDGCGKTHLLNAIRSYIALNFDQLRVDVAEAATLEFDRALIPLKRPADGELLVISDPNTDARVRAVCRELVGLGCALSRADEIGQDLVVVC